MKIQPTFTRQALTLTLALVLVLGAALLAACGGGASRTPMGTPIPTVIPARLPDVSAPGRLAAIKAEEHCPVTAVDLLGAWVQAGMPETESFPFTAADGRTCQATFAEDVLLLMNESNVWYSGALACTACHGPDLAASYANLDLSTHAGILAGSRRQSPDAQGSDILGGGDWEQSRLYQVLITKWMPLGRPPTSPEKGPTLLLGAP